MTPILTITAPTTLRDRDLHVLHAFDRAVRLHLRDLLAAVRRSEPRDLDAATELLHWTDRSRTVVVRHHGVIDGAIAPLLVEVDPLATNLVGAVRAGHRIVGEVLDDLVSALAAWRRAIAVGGEAAERSWRGTVVAVERAVVAVDDQVAREQATFQPALVATVAPRAFDEVRGELLLHADPALLPFLFPWIVRGADPVEEERLVAQLPRMVRTVHRFVWKPSAARSHPRLAAAAIAVDRGLVEPSAA
ncbi:MAG TPA: hypothetical protein P5254_00270 [Aquihabitans sp.]|nr:hypothetical protein [Aquihabitans sp.]